MKRWDVVAAGFAVLALLAVGLQLAVAAADPAAHGDDLTWLVVLVVATGPAVVLGVVVARREPANATGAMLALLGTLPNVVSVLESIVGGPLGEAAWSLHFAGPILLALVFPTGRLLGRRWWLVVAGYLAVPVLMTVVIAVAPEPVSGPLSLALLLVLLACLVAATVAVVLRSRRGDEQVRRQVRWFAVSAAASPLLLTTCMLLALNGGGFDLVGILLALLLLGFSASVAVAMLRHRLYGFDALLAGTVRWLLLGAAVAIVFALFAVLVGLFFGGGSPISVAVATLVAVLFVRPAHRVLRDAVDRRFQPRRTRALAAVRAFTVDVRDGRADPEELTALLSRTLGPGVGVVVDSHGVSRLDADPAVLTPADVRAIESEARLPLELARLRRDLRDALTQTEASRARLVVAADDERRRIQRDLHDGAQSNLVALGMRLRELQRRARGSAEDRALGAELGEAVELVQRTISDLRSLAQGVRPSSLDEGLEPALRSLVRAVPLPVDLTLEARSVPEPIATAVYYVAAEAITNALKHARAGRIGVRLSHGAAGLSLAVHDDGDGGASDAPGSGLAGVRDRVEAAGGRLDVRTGPGAGTIVEAVFP